MTIKNRLACLLFGLSLTMVIVPAEKQRESEPLQDKKQWNSDMSSFSRQDKEDQAFVLVLAKAQQSFNPVYRDTCNCPAGNHHNVLGDRPAGFNKVHRPTAYYVSQSCNYDIYSTSLDGEEGISVFFHKHAAHTNEKWSAIHTTKEAVFGYAYPNAFTLGGLLRQRSRSSSDKKECV